MEMEIATEYDPPVNVSDTGGRLCFVHCSAVPRDRYDKYTQKMVLKRTLSLTQGKAASESIVQVSKNTELSKLIQ